MGACGSSDDNGDGSDLNSTNSPKNSKFKIKNFKSNKEKISMSVYAPRANNGSNATEVEECKRIHSAIMTFCEELGTNNLHLNPAPPRVPPLNSVDRIWWDKERLLALKDQHTRLIIMRDEKDNGKMIGYWAFRYCVDDQSALLSFDWHLLPEYYEQLDLESLQEHIDNAMETMAANQNMLQISMQPKSWVISHVWYDMQVYRCGDEEMSDRYITHPSLPQDLDQLANGTFIKLLQIATLCNNADFVNPDAEPEEKELTGDDTDCAMIRYFNAIYPCGVMRADNERVAEVPFDGENRLHVSIHRNSNDEKYPRMLLVKGPPDHIYGLCSHILINGRVAKITEETTATYQSGSADLASRGERVLALCCIDLDQSQFPEEFEYKTGSPSEYNFPLEGMVFVGLVSLASPYQDLFVDSSTSVVSSPFKSKNNDKADASI